MNQKNHNPCRHHPAQVGRSVDHTSNILHAVLSRDPSTGEPDHIFHCIYEPIDEFNCEKGTFTCQQGHGDNSTHTSLMKLVSYLHAGRERGSRLMNSAFSVLCKRGYSYPGPSYEF